MGNHQQVRTWLGVVVWAFQVVLISEERVVVDLNHCRMDGRSAVFSIGTDSKSCSFGCIFFIGNALQMCASGPCSSRRNVRLACSGQSSFFVSRVPTPCKVVVAMQ